MENPETKEASMEEAAKPSSTVVLRIPKINLQTGLLGLVALITVFQTVQLFRINSRASSASVPASSAHSSPSVSSQGSGANTAAPQSMVGGC